MKSHYKVGTIFQSTVYDKSYVITKVHKNGHYDIVGIETNREFDNISLGTLHSAFEKYDVIMPKETTLPEDLFVL